MTTFIEAITAADMLIGQLQDLAEDGRFAPCFFDRLFGLRTALGSARDRFGDRHDNLQDEGPAFAIAFDRCDQAIALGRDLTPGDAAVAQYAAAVERAIRALTPEPTMSSRPSLRGTLRVRSREPLTFRPGHRRPQAPEPYYASLVKLFPVEAVTLYPLAIGIAAGDVAIRLILIAIIAVFVIALRWFGTQEEGGGDADVLAIGISVVSFLLYAASLGGFGYLPGGPEQTRQLLAFVTVMWVALVPFVLRRSRR